MPPQNSEQARCAALSQPAVTMPNPSKWFTEEVQPHDASLRRYLRRSFPTVRDIDDVVQESYLRIWKRQMLRPISEVTGSVTASVKGFLFQIARRLAVDTLRHNRVSPIDAVTETCPSSVIEDKPGVHEIVCTNQEFELLLEAIDELPGRCREVVVLRKLHGCSVAETAERLGISEETVHVHSRRGLQRVENSLRQRGLNRGPQP